MEPRQKSCMPCAESKRKCDRHRPECRRCIQRDIDCSYPQPKKSRRRQREVPTPSSTPQDQSASDQNENEATSDDILGSILGFGDWDSTAASVINFEVPAPPPFSGAMNDLFLSSIPFPETSLASKKSGPWFLLPDTWDMHHTNRQSSCSSEPTKVEPYIDFVKDLLERWVDSGHTDFVHERLYGPMMPPCLQDAFTTLAAYLHCSKATKDVMLQAAEDGSKRLTNETQPPLGLLDHLAHVQSLFVYVYIRLFDGTIHMRASAERQIPLLRQWLHRTLQVAKHYQGTPQEQALFTSDGQLPPQADYDTVASAWKLWILTECIRRTFIIATVTLNIYECLLRGWEECNGACMFTAGRGLWKADSAMAWSRIVSSKEVHMIPSMQPEPFMSQHSAAEVDDFVAKVWSFIVGPDRIRWWVDQSESQAIST